MEIFFCLLLFGGVIGKAVFPIHRLCRRLPSLFCGLSFGIGEHILHRCYPAGDIRSRGGHDKLVVDCPGFPGSGDVQHRSLPVDAADQHLLFHGFIAAFQHKGVNAVGIHRLVPGNGLRLSDAGAGHGNLGVRRGIVKDDSALLRPVVVICRHRQGRHRADRIIGGSEIKLLRCVSRGAVSAPVTPHMEIPFPGSLPGGNGLAVCGGQPAGDGGISALAPGILEAGIVCGADLPAGGAVFQLIIADVHRWPGVVHLAAGRTTGAGGGASLGVAHILNFSGAADGGKLQFTGSAILYNAFKIQHVGVHPTGILGLAPGGLDGIVVVQATILAVHDLVKHQSDGKGVSHSVGAAIQRGYGHKLGLLVIHNAGIANEGADIPLIFIVTTGSKMDMGAFSYIKQNIYVPVQSNKLTIFIFSRKISPAGG